MQKISAILPVYNEEKYITKCLESLSNQTVKPQEIIVIDDGSTDNTSSIISNFQFSRLALASIRRSGAKRAIFNFQFIRQKHQGPAVARNLGAKKAKGDILVFLDADMTYDRNFLKEITGPIIKGVEIATFTKREYVKNIDNVWAKFWDDVTFSNLGRRVAKELGERGTTFRAILASEFFRVGGYDSYGSSDDRSVLAKLRKSSKNVPSAMYYHYNPSSLSEVFFSARWMGRNTNNRGKFLQFAIFFPPWSILKAVVGSVSKRNASFFPFRLIFDFGYFIGLVNIHITGKHYK